MCTSIYERERFAELLHPLPPDQIEKLWQHWQLLLRWNAKINLTTITSMGEAAVRHYRESIFLTEHLPPGPLRVADVGSGAGFPGIPAAIVRPDCEFTLIESHKRKAVFLKEATRNLPNVRVLAQRAEDVRERFDWIISRAVRWQDVLEPALAPRAALLLSGADAAYAASALPLPCDPKRVVAMFHVEH